jgi:hypothetical protein
MTGNDEREAVASEGPPHGAGSTGRADPIGELPIGDGAAGRNAAGADVHTSLEVSDGRDVERHVDKRIRVSACNQALYSLQHVDDLRRRYRQRGAWQKRSDSRDGCRGCAARKPDGADPLSRPGECAATDGRIEEGEGDLAVAVKEPPLRTGQ